MGNGQVVFACLVEADDGIGVGVGDGEDNGNGVGRTMEVVWR